MKSKSQNKCEAVGCNCNLNFLVQRNWGEVDIVGFCKDHTPEWLKTLPIGETTPNGYYKRIS